jgi:hypothetical protein
MPIFTLILELGEELERAKESAFAGLFIIIFLICYVAFAWAFKEEIQNTKYCSERFFDFLVCSGILGKD